MQKSNEPIPVPASIRIDKRVLEFITCRDEIEAREAEHKKVMAPLYDLMNKLNGALLAILESTGQTSARTEYGLVTIVVVPSASCSDPDLFITYVRENDAYELMDRRANKTACWDYANEHMGVPPPGVKLTSKRTARVTKS